ncbi:putative aspartyl-tRNA synthetase [Phytophthora infestans]|uniref:Putative aspartyl-tRNA synthetase n=2 Tax=Phytophthora infestans TaxID=4787 RepID=A0A8S9UD34_PHYIN|nr:putative aspartyl-tRNA synthetase [Phytophthora infestans]
MGSDRRVQSSVDCWTHDPGHLARERHGLVPMIKFAASVSKKSVVDVYVTLSVPDSPVLSTTQKNVELNIEKFFVVSKALPALPFQVEDAAPPDAR